MSNKIMTKPTIPLTEFRERWAKVQTMMARQDLDFLAAYADDRAVFGPSSPARPKKNTILSVDIPAFNAPWGDLRIEDGYLLTAVGAEKLHTTPYLIPHDS